MFGILTSVLLSLEAHQQFLQMSTTELERLRETVPQLQVNYTLQCAELCQHFQEDLQFHFSLGLNTLSVATSSFPPLTSFLSPSLQAVASTGSWLATLRSKLSIVQSVVSVEYAAPVVLLVTALLVSLTRSHDYHVSIM